MKEMSEVSKKMNLAESSNEWAKEAPVTEGGFGCGDATDEQVILSPDPQVKIAVFKNQILNLRHETTEVPVHLA